MFKFGDNDGARLKNLWGMSEGESSGVSDMSKDVNGIRWWDMGAEAGRRERMPVSREGIGAYENQETEQEQYWVDSR